MILAFLGPNELSVIERCQYYRDGVCKGEVRLHAHPLSPVERSWVTSCGTHGQVP